SYTSAINEREHLTTERVNNLPILLVLLQKLVTKGDEHEETCAGYVAHPFRTKSFEKRETKEKRGVNVKRERAWFLGEGCCVAVGKCSRSCVRGARDGTCV